MPYDTHDTIVARISAAGGAVRGIVRISGPEAIGVFDQLVPGRAQSQSRTPRAMDVTLEVSLHGLSSAIPASALIWPGTRSFTREPTIELHLPGSAPLIEAVIRRAIECGARLAEPGEFTLRAFLAGRIDLTQAEAVLAVIDARGVDALQTALGQLAGGMAGPLAALRSDLINLLADIEAGLDFVEEDIEFVTQEDVVRRLDNAAQQVDRLSGQLGGRSRGDQLPLVVLTGPPNAGKSSLFNALLARFAVDSGRVAAIVSASPGATRDTLLATLEFAGVRFELCDTAGDSDMPGAAGIEAASQSMTRRASSDADVRVICHAPDTVHVLNEQGESTSLRVVTKCDLDDATPVEPIAIRTSAITGEGLEAMVARVIESIREQESTSKASVVPNTVARCGQSLARAAEELVSARELSMHSAGDELVAAEIRAALAHLGVVAGTVSTDDILDQVFSRFCIGK